MFKLLVALIVSIITLIIVAFEPQMHKPVMIGSKEALMKTASIESQDVKFVPQKVGTALESNIKVQNTNITREEYMKSVRMRAKQQEKVVVESPQTVTTPIPAMTPKPKAQAKQKQKEESSKSFMGQINEKIVWNKWRADICNTISNNSLETQSYQLKKGVMFKYSFSVDKNRHITDINVRLVRGASDNITLDSIKDINRTIRSLEGKNILEFPKGTQRTVVKVNGGIEMADYDSSLTPGNFSDIESIRF
ncbi:MAG: hypothetical protein NC408_07560 [Candidatus Gastranaerophilales bacterium]|nr:hypothetical protein [Candidatus Gastranaerophilales bacterium]MCM1072397.1 hypothetical protein [Bacteroides sp.]